MDVVAPNWTTNEDSAILAAPPALVADVCDALKAVLVDAAFEVGHSTLSGQDLFAQLCCAWPQRSVATTTAAATLEVCAAVPELRLCTVRGRHARLSLECCTTEDFGEAARWVSERPNRCSAVVYATGRQPAAGFRLREETGGTGERVQVICCQCMGGTPPTWSVGQAEFQAALLVQVLTAREEVDPGALKEEEEEKETACRCAEQPPFGRVVIGTEGSQRPSCSFCKRGGGGGDATTRPPKTVWRRSRAGGGQRSRLGGAPCKVRGLR